MPILSQYWFGNEGFFAGSFDGFNEPYPLGGWAWITGGQSQATLAWNRADDETVIDFASVLSNPLVTNTIDGFLTGDVSRTSSVMANGVFWNQVPYENQNPSAHSPTDMLVRVYFDFHIHTPWYCSDADGWIGFYVFFYLDGAGALNAYVDGWWYSYDGGGPFCTGTIDDDLNKAIPGAIPSVQKLVNEAVALLASSHYSTLYYLPGNGTQSQGGFNQNADTDVALVLLPR
ncbi:MAG: hypothetical protein WBV80_10220 [Mycobacterium sp.]